MLSANQIVRKKVAGPMKLKVVDGLIHIFKGAHLNYEAANIGYAKLGSDTLSEEYAGIAMEELNVAAADNTADGTFEIEVLPRGNGDLVEMDITSNITVANEGDPVYVDGDDKVDIASGILNTTGGLVGIIRQFISTNKAWVQMVQHPVL
jgi:hypothetical protein